MLYGVRKVVPLNKHRFDVVEKKTYKQRFNVNHPFEKLKSIAGSSIPPCDAKLAPYMDRSGFVARLWGNTHHQNLGKIPTIGWEKIDEEYRVIWFIGKQLPPALIPEMQVDTEPDDNAGDAPADGGDGVDEDHDPLPREMESSDEDSEDDHE